MSPEQLLAEVQELFRDNFDDDAIVLTRETTADDIEDWDSLEQINLLTAIKKKYNIPLTLADTRDLKNVGDMIDLIVRLSK